MTLRFDRAKYFQSIIKDLKFIRERVSFSMEFHDWGIPSHEEKIRKERVIMIQADNRNNKEGYKSLGSFNETNRELDIRKLMKTSRDNSIITTIRMNKHLRQLLLQIAEKHGRSLNYFINLFCACGVLGLKNAPTDTDRPLIFNYSINMSKPEGNEVEEDPYVLKCRIRKLERRVKILEEEKKILKEELREYEKKEREIEELHNFYQGAKEILNRIIQQSNLLKQIDEALLKISRRESIDPNLIKELRYGILGIQREIETLTHALPKIHAIELNAIEAGR